MSSGGTRAGRAASSRRVKQELVRLLFGKQYSKTGPEGHKKLDSAAYSHSELKRAYFSRLQEIHPDKNKTLESSVGEEAKKQFHALQEAWDQYEDLAKAMERVQSKGQTNFTKFGVGCSFSDNEQERALRAEIMDQAGRGWFSSGLLPAESSDASEKPTPTISHATSLISDDLFVEVGDEPSPEDLAATKTRKKSSSRTLIPGYKG
eukprot:scaffold1900_cov123-Cylindrotheca_fusiformis.AAC.21